MDNNHSGSIGLHLTQPGTAWPESTWVGKVFTTLKPLFDFPYSLLNSYSDIFHSPVLAARLYRSDRSDRTVTHSYIRPRLSCIFFSSIIIRLVLYLFHKFALELTPSLITSLSDEDPFF